MDPTTTLFTFMLETHPSVQTVTLVGSWDNFSKHYTMERDVRRDRGQWRGCYNFKDITCDEGQLGPTRRNGGLKMGHPYYFYYEVDGSFETHDPALPSTTTCPYLPGQTVNTMVVPAEITDRKRSASLTALRRDEYMTMEPTDKYVPLRPPPAIPDFLGPNYRLPTSHSTSNSHTTSSTITPTLRHKRSDRSISPTPSWWSPRKLFGRKGSLSSQGSVDRATEDEEHRCSVTSSTSSEGTRTRAMSPEALKRFLISDNVPAVPEAEPAERIELSIPDDIAEEEDDDFLASAVSDNMPKTILSPPPPMPGMSRKNSSNSAETLRYPTDSASVITLMPAPNNRPAFRQPVLSSITFCEQHEEPISRFSLSSDDGSVYDDEEEDDDDDDRNEDVDPNSPSTDNDTPSFYHSDEEEEENDVEDSLSSPAGILPLKRSALTMGRESLEKSLAEAFQEYRLPRTSVDGTKGGNTHVSPSLVPNSGEASVVNSPPLLAMPANSVVTDFVSELKEAGLG